MKAILCIFLLISMFLFTACDKIINDLGHIFNKSFNITSTDDGSFSINGTELKFTGKQILIPFFQGGKLDVSESIADINLTGNAKPDSLEITYREFSKGDAEVYLDNTTIKIRTKSGKPAMITLIKGQVPNDLNLSLSTSSGDILVSSMQNTTSLYLNSSSGDLAMTNCASPSSTMETSSGDIALTGCNFVGLTAQTSSGDITVTDCSIDQMTGSTSAGDINIVKSKIKERHLNTSAGDVNDM